MSPRVLVSVGAGLLLLGLLLMLGIEGAVDESQQAFLVQGYLANVCSLVGSGLLVAAGLVSALRAPRTARQEPETPMLDHYS